MRTFEERKAEVMRRSKVRIAHRRRAIAGALCCFVLLVTVICVNLRQPTPDLYNGSYTGSAENAEDSSGTAPSYGGLTDGNQNGTATAGVTVSDGAVATRYEDKDDVAAILSALENAKASTEPVKEDFTDGYANGSLLPEVQTESTATVTGLLYTITVSGDGVYRLVPNALVDVTAQLRYELSDETYRSLLAAIGVS